MHLAGETNRLYSPERFARPLADGRDRRLRCLPPVLGVLLRPPFLWP